MKLINLILLLLPFTGFSQVKMLRSIDSLTANYHSLHLASNDTFKIVDEFEYKGNRYTLYTNGWVKDSVIPKKRIAVLDSGMKVEVVETRDTIYNCPVKYRISYFPYDGSVDWLEPKKINPDCKLEKVITTRRYKLYIINEYGQKEYLSMELTKTK